MEKEEYQKYPRPVTELTEKDFFLIGILMRDEGWVQRKAITVLIRAGLWLEHHHPDLFAEFKVDMIRSANPSNPKKLRGGV